MAIIVITAIIIIIIITITSSINPTALFILINS